ncbi:MAG: response regulator transcription factor [Acidobacteriales bacterium]|nr:response regulator transcription factor [Terriglobales bacterium]
MSAEGVVRSARGVDKESRPDLAPTVVALGNDGELARLLQPALVGAGYTVESLDQFSSLDGLQDNPPAVFLLEYGIQQNNTIVLCRAIRSHPAFAKAAILLLAKEADEADRVLGLEAGADAYLAMPIAPRELLAQIKAVLRSYSRQAEREHLSVANIEVDVPAMLARVSGRAVTLSITEFRLLEFLCRNAGRAVSRDQLVKIVSKNGLAGRRAVDVYVRRLRQKI